MTAPYARIALVEGTETVVSEKNITPPASADEIAKLTNGRPMLRPITDAGLSDIPVGIRAAAEFTYSVEADSVTKNWTLNLEAARPLAYLLIGQAAEAARLQYITGGDGQAMVYRQKQAEAAAYLAAESPDPDDYLFLKRRAERLNPESPDYAAVANEWNAVTLAWQTIAADIEDIREAAKETVAAGDAAAIATVLNGLDFSEVGE